MSKLETLKMSVSPLTSEIYAGYVKGDHWISKVNVTDQVIKAIIEHLKEAQCDYGCSLGTLSLKPSIRE
jgi:hypothetical protein